MNNEELAADLFETQHELRMCQNTRDLLLARVEEGIFKNATLRHAIGEHREVIESRCVTPLMVFHASEKLWGVVK